MVVEQRVLDLSHRVIAERVISVMRERLDETLTLEALAEIGSLSPYHFCRVFRQVTGIPPHEFLTALRLAAAKRLLLTTPLSVTDICFEVGYSSLGSFTTRFTHSVGLPPLRLRQLVEGVAGSPRLAPGSGDSSIDLQAGIRGEVLVPGGFVGMIHVGVFPTRLPRSRPVGCTRLAGPGIFCIRDVPDGRYYLLAVAYSRSYDVLSYLLSEHGSYVGCSEEPVLVRGGQALEMVKLHLRPPRSIDPPILTAAPFVNQAIRGGLA